MSADKSFEAEFKKISTMLEKTNSSAAGALSLKPGASQPGKISDEDLQKNIKLAQTSVRFLKYLNQALSLMIGGLIVYAAAYCLWLSERGLVFPALDTSKPVEATVTFSSYPPPLASYLNVMNERSIFEPFEDAGAVDAKAAAQAASELLANYKIVGLVMDAKPMVILEDLKLHQTLFLSKGDQFNGITVESIEAGRLQFNYQGQIVTLNP